MSSRPEERSSALEREGEKSMAEKIQMVIENVEKPSGTTCWSLTGQRIDVKVWPGNFYKIAGTIGDFVFDSVLVCYDSHDPEKKLTYNARKRGDSFKIRIFIPVVQGKKRDIDVTASYGDATWGTGGRMTVQDTSGGGTVQEIELKWPLRKYKTFAQLVAEGTSVSGAFIVRVDDGREFVFLPKADEWSLAKEGVFTDKNFSEKWGRSVAGPDWNTERARRLAILQSQTRE